MDDSDGWRALRPPPPNRGPRSPFAHLSTTHALAMGGDALLTVALAGSVFFSISPNAARGRVALSLLLTMAPFAVVAPFLGPAIDRSRRGRRGMVVLSCAGRAAGCLAMVEVLDGLLLFPAAFTLLVLSKAYSVAKSSLVPAAVTGPDELVEANAKLAITGVLAGFLAAAPGVIILRLADARWVLRLGSVLFLAAAVNGLRLVSGPVPVAEGPLEAATGRVPTHIGSRLGSAAAAMALLRALVGFLVFHVAFAFRRQQVPSWWFGFVLAASMVASLVAAATAPRLRQALAEERILAVCLLVVGVAGLAVARLQGGLWAALVAAAVGLAATAGKLAFDALVQRDAPDAVRGRSFARFESGFQLVWVVGALLPVVVPTPLRQGFDVIGIAGLLACVSFLAAGRQHDRRPA